MIRRSRGSKDSGDWPELSAKVVPELWPQRRLKHIFQTGPAPSSGFRAPHGGAAALAPIDLRLEL